MEQAETRELPGNDASWYRALLVDEDNKTVAEAPPQQQSLQLEPAIDADQRDEPRPNTSSEQELDARPLKADYDEDTTLDGATEHDSVLASEPPPRDEPASQPDLAPDDETISTVPTDALEPEEARTPEADLVVEPPLLTGETEPIHFPEEAASVEDRTPSPAAVSPPDAAPLITSVPTTEPAEGLDNTSEMVGQLWTSREPDDSFEAWAPDEMDNKINSSRPFRWTSVIAALAVIALIVVGLVLLPSLTRTRADAHREMMVVALRDLRAELPDTQASLQAATEPTTDSPALSDLSTQLTVLTARASDVEAAATEPLPSAPPFTSTVPIDELIPVQRRLEPLATTAGTIQRRIGNVAQYRVLMTGFLALPDLPATADTATQADLRVVLASAQAESASILAELPSDISLSEHQDLARSISESFGSWQIEYLEALRTQDPRAATNLVEQLRTQLAELSGELVTPLAQIRRQTDTDLIDLARSLDEVIALASGSIPAP